MNLPGFLIERPDTESHNVLHATSMTVLGAFADQGLIQSTELEYGFEDLPLLASLSGILRDAARNWHQRSGTATDFRVLQRGFVHAYLAGLGVAIQLTGESGKEITTDSDLRGILDGGRVLAVGSPLSEWALESTPEVQNVFVSFQDQSLAIAASTKNQTLLGDFFACGCLWASLAGVETGLTRLGIAQTA